MDKYCRSCKSRHPEPTGKECPARIAKKPSKGISSINTGSNENAALGLMQEMRGTMMQFMDQVNQKMSQMQEDIATRRRSGDSSIPSHGDGTPSSKRSHSSSPARKSPKKTPKKETPKKGDHSLPPDVSAAGSTAQGKLKSGREQTATDVILNRVQWPHYYVTTAEQKPKKYDALSLSEFVYGYMCILAHEPNVQVQQVMQRHLRELMLDEKQYFWEDVRSFHALVLAGMEAGTHSWMDYEGIQHLRQRKGYPNLPKQLQQGKTKSRIGVNIPNVQNVCSAFNQGTCQQPDDHDNLVHCCKWCLENLKRSYKHGDVGCRNKTGRGRAATAKNEQSQASQPQQ